MTQWGAAEMYRQVSTIRWQRWSANSSPRSGSPDHQDKLPSAHHYVSRSVAGMLQAGACALCGACSYACPEHKVELVNFVDQGIRSVLPTAHARTANAAIA